LYKSVIKATKICQENTQLILWMKIFLNVQKDESSETEILTFQKLCIK